MDEKHRIIIHRIVIILIRNQFFNIRLYNTYNFFQNKIIRLRILQTGFFICIELILNNNKKRISHILFHTNS